MFRRALDLTRWPVPVILLFAGTMAVGLAFASVNLFQHGMANLSLIRRHGVLALQEGAALQLAELLAGGLIALLCYLGFKFSEVELSVRYRRWCEGQASSPNKDKSSPPTDED